MKTIKRPKICVPIIERGRDSILDKAEEYAKLPVELAEWRVDFFAGYERELLSIVEELKGKLKEKELLVTLRTEAEGGEPNGSRFDYEKLIADLLEQDIADYVDVEIQRMPSFLLEKNKGERHTRIIGSYHDFQATPKKEDMVAILTEAMEKGCDMGKLACMPKTPEDVDVLLEATAQMKETNPDYPVITMSMGEWGKKSRLYGGLYGSEVSFGCVGEGSAPGQIPLPEMTEVFDKIYSGKRHIVLIGFMGVGKSTISRELQRLSNRPEVDTDAWIEEKEGRSISDIFAAEGEEYFRQQETALIDELGKMKASIVSCGGGMALREINVRKLQALGEVVLLTAKPETIFERVRHSTNRPILNGNMNVEFISGLMEKRRPFYEKAATVTVSTDDRRINEIAKEILEKCC